MDIHDYILDLKSSVNSVKLIECPFKRLSLLRSLEVSAKETFLENSWVMGCSFIYKEIINCKYQIRANVSTSYF